MENGTRFPRPQSSQPTVDLHRLPEYIRQLSIARWGERQATVLIGRDPALFAALEKVVRFGASEAPVLITGETGTGKELFARILFLLSRRNGKPFLRVNCAQYTSEQLIVSELFGHKKGSFTGAVADHRGIFEEADGGVVFLDEIAELPLSAQAVLLRVLSEGEIVPVGGSRPKMVDVRVITASNRNLKRMVAEGKFREDLYFRLRYLSVEIPPLRERGDDWELIARYYLEKLSRKYDRPRYLGGEAIRQLRRHSWPGNVREVKSCIETGFHMSQGREITFRDLAEALEVATREDQLRKVPFAFPAAELCARMASGEESFWDVVYRPFMDRDMSRAEARAVIAEGLRLSGGSYKRLLDIFNIAQEDYLKFMDFLRHHNLKPDTHTRVRRSTAPACRSSREASFAARTGSLEAIS